MSNKARELYSKFDVQRADGRDLQGGDRQDARYFVLDLTYDPFAMAALEAYANQCQRLYPALAADLFRIVDNGPTA